MAPHSSTLAWKIPWTEEPGRLQSMGSHSQTRLNNFTFTFHFSLSCIGEWNGNPLQCSCLENPRDGGACWAAIYGVAQSRTRLKWLSSMYMTGHFFSYCFEDSLFVYDFWQFCCMLVHIFWNLLYLEFVELLEFVCLFSSLDLESF